MLQEAEQKAVADSRRTELLSRWADWVRDEEVRDRDGRAGVVEATEIRDDDLYVRVQFRNERTPRELLVIIDGDPPPGVDYVRVGTRKANDRYRWGSPRKEVAKDAEPDARLIIQTEVHTPTRAAQVRRDTLVERLGTALAQAIEDVLQQLEVSIDDIVAEATPRHVASKRLAIYVLTVTVDLHGFDETRTHAARQLVQDFLVQRDHDAWENVLRDSEVEEVSATRFTMKGYIGERPLPTLEGRLYLHAPRRPK